METKERTGCRPSSQKQKAVPGTEPRRPAQKRKPRPQQPGPEVVYTQPGPFNRNRFLLHLATVVLVVLAMVFGVSLFFKVDLEKTTVAGNEIYTPEQIVAASGLQGGENLMTVRETAISSRVMEKLPYIYKVRVGIKLPDTVKLMVEELDVVYSVEAEDGQWWLLRADGQVVEKTNSADAGQHTKLLGVKLHSPEQGKMAAALEPVPEETTAEGETVPVTVSGSQRLQTAITIFQYLEDYGIIGGAASVNVENLSELELWYGERFQVTLGDETQLAYKIQTMKSTIDRMNDYDSGILDVSFTVMEDKVVYTPFS
ncbi:MAG: FtsQ-type POTRA domain-containing protein [Oscillospiraceae bacterium]|nr:FtsQ-type POTRA domain-containing protein [Oscillospiraceae bacterium]